MKKLLIMIVAAILTTASIASADGIISSPHLIKGAFLKYVGGTDKKIQLAGKVTGMPDKWSINEAKIFSKGGCNDFYMPYMDVVACGSAEKRDNAPLFLVDTGKMQDAIDSYAVEIGEFPPISNTELNRTGGTKIENRASGIFKYELPTGSYNWLEKQDKFIHVSSAIDGKVSVAGQTKNSKVSLEGPLMQKLIACTAMRIQKANDMQYDKPTRWGIDYAYPVIFNYYETGRIVGLTELAFACNKK
jgi:hypothetical protein